MGYLVLAAVPLAPAVWAAFYWWLKRTRTSFFWFLLSTVPVVSFGWLVYLVLGTEAADPSSGEIVLPFMLGGLGIFFLVVAAFQKRPQQSKQVTDVVAVAGLGLIATRKYQKMRDRERAEALAEQLDRERLTK